MNNRIALRVQEIEDALAIALNQEEFVVVHSDGERYLEPILKEHGIDLSVRSFPRLSLTLVARDLERLLP
ncbi:hypothetical protein F9L06_03760 [Brucella anthropi]|uniref:Uncharacterized protein n=1 Tax=Brucella anthropi TaxID=529 RepID=A0A6I0DW96_BRUAN|nr:hypothetical protein [Brucella anthropi]KAB2803283.1 hypothetical protein F9L06_03760 [Brucella anthropi]